MQHEVHSPNSMERRKRVSYLGLFTRSSLNVQTDYYCFRCNHIYTYLQLPFNSAPLKLNKSEDIVQCVNFYVTQRCTTTVSVVQFSFVIGACHFVFLRNMPHLSEDCSDWPEQSYVFFQARIDFGISLQILFVAQRKKDKMQFVSW